MMRLFIWGLGIMVAGAAAGCSGLSTDSPFLPVTDPVNPLPWEATATVRGDTIDVRYNLNMVMSDFMDGPYVLVR